MMELVNREIGGQGRLLPLFPYKSHAHICCLDHTYIVATITNGRRALLSEDSNKASYLCLRIDRITPIC